jgi:hypothetical protein
MATVPVRGPYVKTVGIDRDDASVPNPLQGRGVDNPKRLSSDAAGSPKPLQVRIGRWEG